MKGKIFIELGGYTIPYEKDLREKRTQSLKDDLLIGGTIAAAFAAFLLVVNEVLKNFHWLGTVSFWTVLLLCLMSAASGIIICLTVLHLIREKK